MVFAGSIFYTIATNRLARPPPPPRSPAPLKREDSVIVKPEPEEVTIPLVPVVEDGVQREGVKVNIWRKPKSE